jgi:hypothetical protein
MAGATIEVKYFNTFVLKKTVSENTPSDQPLWNGSFGIPTANYGSYPVVADTTNPNNFAIEESRIRGGYNNTTVDFSPRAYLVEDEPNALIRQSSLIYSGVFNSRTGINDTNVFPVGKDITKTADPANGSIQKLYAEDTNLIVFQQYKVSRALIDKDAIYSAEGGGTVTSSNLVIGVLQPYAGRYGISDNPESFAVYGYRKYFTDKINNVVLRLSRDGMTEISAYGMTDFFRDEMSNVSVGGSKGLILGSYDLYSDMYTLSLQQTGEQSEYKTLTFDDTINGWTSLYDYSPDQMFTIRNKFYSIKNNELWQHYNTAFDGVTVNRGNFYGVSYPSSVTVIFNPDPIRSKTFSTVSYEGNNGWKLTAAASDGTGENKDYSLANAFLTTFDQVNNVLSYTEGAYDSLGNTGTSANPLNQPLLRAGFDRKENAYVANLVNSSAPAEGEIIFGNQISGIKGFYVTATFSTDTVTDPGGEKQLFSVATDFFSNNGF